MAENVSNLSEVLKEVWTQDRLEAQFYSEHRFLDKVEKTNKYTIGRQAQVPLELSYPGGYSAVPGGGSSSLNSADNLHVDRADYTLANHWQQVAVEAEAINQADSRGARSTVDAVDQTITSNVLSLRKEINRQAVANGDALIAATTGTASSTEVELDSTGFGFDAIVRGWLRPGMTVDIGTAADEDSVSGDRSITAVEEDPDTPSITVDTSVTLVANEFVSVANARVGTTSHEMSGLRTIAGSTTSEIGGLDPDTAGEEVWKPAKVDSSTTTVSLDLLLELQRAVYQKTGKWPNYVTTSPKQCAALYALFQNQVRFSGDSSTAAGGVDGFTWNGMTVNVDPDIPDRELYMLTLSDFICITGGSFGKPTWASDIEGAGGRLRWGQGTTAFHDAVTYPLQLGVKRRNSHAAATSLTD